MLILVIISNDKEVDNNIIPYGAIIFKPINFRILSELIKNYVIGKKIKSTNLLSFKNIFLNQQNREVIMNKSQVKLNNKEFSLLEYFILNKGKTLKRKRILEDIWDRNHRTLSNTVDVHIKNLRKKLNLKCLVTIPKLGYKLE